MLRTFILMVSFLIILPASHPAVAQSTPGLPSRIIVSSSARTLRVGQLTEIRLALLDQQGQEIGATEDTTINLICTKLKDLSSAKSEARESNYLSNEVLELPDGKISTIQSSLTIPRGQTGATVKFRSQQTGTIRIFAESEKLVAGSTLIAVISDVKRAAAETSSAIKAYSFQEEPASPSYSLSLEADGTEIPPIINREWVRKLNVLLKSGEDLVPAIEPVEVFLKIESGEATLSTQTATIASDQVVSDVIELRTSVGGEIRVSARVVRRGQVPINSTQSTFQFPMIRRATKLLVDALPPIALANGLEAIQLRVRAVDDGNNTIRAEEEGLEERDVVFKLEGRALGLKFDQGVTKLTIPKGEVAAAINIFGSSPVAGTKVIAESENGIRKAITGVTKVEFSFPWWQLGLAMLGGFIVQPLRKLMQPLHKTIRRKRRRSANHSMKLTDLVKKGLIGLIIGGLFFVIIFFGAAVMDGFNWSGITINLTRLPLHNGVAALSIGILGSLLIDKRSFFAASITRTVGKLKAARA